MSINGCQSARRTPLGAPASLDAQRRPLAQAVAAVLLGLALATPCALAQAEDSRASAVAEMSFDAPAGPLAPALRSLASSANVLLTFTAEQTAGKVTRGVKGHYSFDRALALLLDGSGLVGVPVDGGYVLRGATGNEVALPAETVWARGGGASLPAAYAGGQVASGSQVGVLGNKDAMDTPFSTVSYTQQTIQNEQARSIADVLFANDPSVRASIGASNRYDAFTIRGLRVANSDVALNGLYGLVPNWRIGIDSVERIELLKGPGAFLYGMAPGGAVGGNVNLVTKRADAEPLTRLTTSYSSDSLFSQHVDIGRRLGSEQQFGVRLNASANDGDTPYDGQKLHGADLSLGLDFQGERLRLSGDFIYQHDRTSAPVRSYNIASGVAVPSVPNPRNNLSQSYDYSRSDSLTGLLRAEYDLSDQVTVFAAVGANKFDFEKRETNGGTIISDSGDVSIANNALQTGQYRTLTGETGVRGKFDTGPIGHEVNLSVNALTQDYDLGQIAYANYISNLYSPVRTSTAQVSAYPEGRASELSMHSVALADTLAWHDDLVQLTLGLRQQYVESKSFSGTTGRMTRHYDDDVLSPTVGLVIRPTEELSLYANYIEGLTPGPTPPSSAVNSGEVFAPFKSKQYEVGAKVDLGQVGFGISAFQIDMPNGITNPGTGVYGLDGLQRNRGLELTAFGEAWSRLRILGGATFFDARQDKTSGGSNDDRFAVGVPRMQSTLGTEWDVPWLERLTLTSRVIYTGKTYMDNANQQEIASWSRVDLGARYAFKVNQTPMTVRGMVTNVFDRRYWETNPSGYIVAGAPPTAWLSLSMDF
ncbi:MAG: Ferric-anguibactin receptor FatA [Pseudomonas citronellolis]|nr:MAG: Ferric-anguibactin receptor FatA [Pseudomonas citronellolis]